MEDKDLDRLFRQKLETFEATPSSQAWQQLEQNLHHKQKRKAWHYLSGIAACLLLVFGIWGAMELSQPFNQAQQLATEEKEETPLTGTTPEAQKEEIIKETFTKAIPAIAEIEKEKPAPVATKSKADTKKKEKGTLQQADPLAASVSHTAAAKDKLPDLQLEPKPLQIESLAEANAQPVIESPESAPEEIIIRYTPAEEVMAVASIEEEGTSSGEKELSARKLLGFFKKVTSNNNLADLREAKNELLSLDRLSSPN
ncbi:hypothetical protein [Nafulsella turpanensis]|uniref:hypothetical protein n=1 Tax=Nafulsella turpanensis TaxID=1265690 RepID=UPI00034A761B|nr:hypothetical protein [Nafulsella turpanensis]